MHTFLSLLLLIPSFNLEILVGLSQEHYIIIGVALLLLAGLVFLFYRVRRQEKRGVELINSNGTAPATPPSPTVSQEEHDELIKERNELRKLITNKPTLPAAEATALMNDLSERFTRKTGISTPDQSLLEFLKVTVAWTETKPSIQMYYLLRVNQSLFRLYTALQQVYSEQSADSDFTRRIHRVLVGTNEARGLRHTLHRLSAPAISGLTASNFFDTVFDSIHLDAITQLIRLQQYETEPAVAETMTTSGYQLGMLNKPIDSYMKALNSVHLSPVPIELFTTNLQSLPEHVQVLYETKPAPSDLHGLMRNHQFSPLMDRFKRHTVYDLARIGFQSSHTSIEVPKEQQKTLVYAKDF